MSAASIETITVEHLRKQEQCFAAAFASGDLERLRPLYAPDVVYISPTVRLYDWPARIEGVDKILEFIGLTVRQLKDITYEAVDFALTADRAGAFVCVHFDWAADAKTRLRCRYAILYRYRERLIATQELFYDPSGRLEVIASSSERISGPRSR
jgi:ketosteroid isomerase-like protein